MKYETIEGLKGQSANIQLACQTFGVSSSGYYAWKRRGESLRERENQSLKQQIVIIHQQSQGTYGEPRIRAQLKQATGKSYGRQRVARLMKQAEISGLQKRRFKVKTTDSKHDLPIAERLFQVEQSQSLPKAPNRVWASDISSIQTAEGFLYLAIFLDVFTRKIVGYATADTMKTELVLEALNRALLQQKPIGCQLISHSDRGSQYAAESFRQRLKLLQIQPSMSRTGNCYDNAYAESFFHSLKVEWIYRRDFQTRKEAQLAIFEYIETWYNPKRLHSALGYQAPNDYEQLYSPLAA